MTTQQIMTTFNALSLIGFLSAILWQVRKTRQGHILSVLCIEATRKMLEVQKAVDTRHVLIIRSEAAHPVPAMDWDEATAEIEAKELQLDMAMAAMRKQLTKL